LYSILLSTLTTLVDAHIFIFSLIGLLKEPQVLDTMDHVIEFLTV